MPAFRAAAMARAIWSRCSYPLATWRALGAASAAAGDAPGSPQGTTLRVATFNLLADQYAEGGFHSHCPPKYLVWDYRRPRLLEQILALDADIICLQEVERPFFDDDLSPLLRQRGYEGWYQGRSGSGEGIALLVRTSRLHPEAVRGVQLVEALPAGPETVGGFWDAVAGRGEGTLLAVLRERESGRQLVAGCTHLFWNPQWPDIKLVQAHLLCTHIARFVSEAVLPGASLLPASVRGRMPVVLGGDFNSLPLKTISDAFDTVPEGGALVSGVYELLSQGEVGPNHQDHPARRQRKGGGGLAAYWATDAGLALASAGVAAWGAEPPATNSTASFSGCLDYIWYSRAHWEVVEALELPYAWPAEGSSGDQNPLPPLPNEVFSSDHLPCGFTLRLLPER